jgi:hypothetical protein
MLAYVFWHWRHSAIAPDAYEELQRSFHRALAGEPPAGFSRSWSVALHGAEWANDGETAYEDWYLLRDFAALETLNEGAISASRRVPHNAAAAVAGGGTAGLYGLRLGDALSVPRFSVWLSKPGSTPYQRFFDELGPVVARSKGALWMRQMVLGPTPEFCLQSSMPATLPESLGGRAFELRPIYPG